MATIILKGNSIQTSGVFTAIGAIAPDAGWPLFLSGKFCKICLLLNHLQL